MKKKIALLVYPQFSMQEIGNTCALFRWYFDTTTVVFSTNLEEVPSEEGIRVKPEKRTTDFRIDDYDCLILPGCSDVREAMKDKVLIDFLRSFKEYPDFVIGAICAGPMFLSMAGLLDDKRFTNSLYVEMNERLPFINDSNLVYAPLVEDGNIITATGDAYADFAIALARKVGHACSDNAYRGVLEENPDQDVFKHHLDEHGIRAFEEAFAAFL